MEPTSRGELAGGLGDISSDRVLCCRQLDLPGMDTAGAPKMGKGGFKLFVPDMEQKLMISWDGQIHCKFDLKENNGL